MYVCVQSELGPYCAFDPFETKSTVQQAQRMHEEKMAAAAAAAAAGQGSYFNSRAISMPSIRDATGSTNWRSPSSNSTFFTPMPAPTHKELGKILNICDLTHVIIY